jgi:hypothetical protein
MATPKTVLPPAIHVLTGSAAGAILMLAVGFLAQALRQRG